MSLPSPRRLWAGSSVRGRPHQVLEIEMLRHTSRRPTRVQPVFATAPAPPWPDATAQSHPGCCADLVQAGHLQGYFCARCYCRSQSWMAGLRSVLSSLPARRAGSTSGNLLIEGLPEGLTGANLGWAEGHSLPRITTRTVTCPGRRCPSAPTPSGPRSRLVTIARPASNPPWLEVRPGANQQVGWIRSH